MRLPQQCNGVRRLRIEQTDIQVPAEGGRATVLAQRFLYRNRGRNSPFHFDHFAVKLPNEGDISECYPADSYLCLQFVANCVESGCGAGSVGGNNGPSGYFCDCRND